MANKQPSYLEYINNFWRVNDEFQFSSTQAHCYFILLSEFNRKRWIEELALSDLVLCEMMGVSLNTMRGAKKALVEQELITFVKGGKGHGNKTRYQLRCQSRCQVRCQSRSQDLTATPIYKTNKDYKTKNNYNNDGTKKGFDISKGDFD